MKKLAIFGSGSGSNAENICNYFRGSDYVDIACIFTNNKEAFIVKRANKLKIPIIYISKKELLDFFGIYKTLKSYNIDYIILAGFLLKIPEKFINFYQKKIINIHPSLLPKYKGLNTHKKAIENNDKYAGCSVHFVTAKIDSGKIIMQKKVRIKKNDTVDSLSKKVLKKEHLLYPAAIKKIYN